jgi:hypothetical protein
LKIDAALTAGQRDMSLLITGMLDDALYVRFGLTATELMRGGGAMIHSIVSVQT